MVDGDTRRKAYVDKSNRELAELATRGVVLAGNAFSSVVLCKGEMDSADAEGLLSGADGDALRASLVHLGYEPQDWAGIATLDAQGNSLTPDLFRYAIAVLDPATLVLLDDAAAELARQTWASELSAVSDLDQAVLVPGVVTHILGMRVLALGGFAAALGDMASKQLMWARLKRIPPLGEPLS